MLVQNYQSLNQTIKTSISLVSNHVVDHVSSCAPTHYMQLTYNIIFVCLLATRMLKVLPAELERAYNADIP